MLGPSRRCLVVVAVLQCALLCSSGARQLTSADRYAAREEDTVKKGDMGRRAAAPFLHPSGPSHKLSISARAAADVPRAPTPPVPSTVRAHSSPEPEAAWPAINGPQRSPPLSPLSTGLPNLSVLSASPSSWPSLGEACAAYSPSSASCASGARAYGAHGKLSARDVVLGVAPAGFATEPCTDPISDAATDRGASSGDESGGEREGGPDNEGCNSRDAVVDPASWAPLASKRGTQSPNSAPPTTHDADLHSFGGSSLGEHGGELSPSHGVLAGISETLSAPEPPALSTPAAPASDSSAAADALPSEDACEAMLSSLLNLDMQAPPHAAVLPPLQHAYTAPAPTQARPAAAAALPLYAAALPQHAGKATFAGDARRVPPMPTPPGVDRNLLRAIHAQLSALQATEGHAAAAQAPMHASHAAGVAQGASNENLLMRKVALLQQICAQQEQQQQPRMAPPAAPQRQYALPAETPRQDLQLLQQLLLQQAAQARCERVAQWPRAPQPVRGGGMASVVRGGDAWAGDAYGGRYVKPAAYHGAGGAGVQYQSNARAYGFAPGPYGERGLAGARGGFYGDAAPAYSRAAVSMPMQSQQSLESALGGQHLVGARSGGQYGFAAEAVRYGGAHQWAMRHDGYGSRRY